MSQQAQMAAAEKLKESCNTIGGGAESGLPESLAGVSKVRSWFLLNTLMQLKIFMVC